MINSKNKGKMFAAVGGAIVGAGAVLAGAVAMSDRKNQEKGKTNIKKVANKAIKSVEKVTKMAKMKVRKI